MQRINDDSLVARYRSRFGRGPIGVWCTYLGGGAEMTHGAEIVFNADSSPFKVEMGSLRRVR